MTNEELIAVIANIRYKPGFKLELKEYESTGRLFLQVKALGAEEVLSGRKWNVTQHMSVSELIQTAFKAFLTFEEHECREAFAYKGQKVLGPHVDLEVLAELLRSSILGEDRRA